MTPTSPAFDPASFRDPAGKVFAYEGRIYRSLAPTAQARLERFVAEGHLADLAETGLHVPSRLLVAAQAGLDPALVGDKVVASMMRQGAEGDFRSNLHRGGSAKAIRITPEERSTAVRAAKIMGLNVCGVDLLRSNHGPVVMEVNSSPGLEGVEKATGVDVAAAIIGFMERHATHGKTRTRGKG